MNTNYLVPFFLGTFSGFLATLPIGPAKILAVRKFLILSKGASQTGVYNLKSANAILIASISGLIFAQVLFFLALQYPFLYSLWVKPHFFSLLFLATIFVYLDTIKNINFDVYSNQPFLTTDSTFSRIQASFLETLFIQLLNPIVLPNPIFCRLNNIFLFRYSTIGTFLAGNFLGLIGGYVIFFVSTLFLLKKLELDAPTIYRLFKIKIHQYFLIVFFGFSCLCLSRSPLLSFNKLIGSAPTFSFSKSLVENFWPNSFFRADISSRPLRLLNNTTKKFPPNESIKPFNKMAFSQYFFEGAKQWREQGAKPHLYQNFPQSLSIVSNNINSLIKQTKNRMWVRSLIEQKEKTILLTNNTNLLTNWINEKKQRQNQINKIINNKINSLEKGIFLEELVDKKLSSFNKKGIKISKQLDPRLNSDGRGRELFFTKKSFLFLTEEFCSKKDSLFSIEKKKLTDTHTKNRLKLFLTRKYQNFDTFPFIQWKRLVQASSDGNQYLLPKLLSNNSYKPEENNITNIDFVEKILDLNVFKNPLFKHELFEKLFIYLQKSLNIQNQRIQEEKTEWKQDETTAKMVPIYKSMPLCNPLLTRDKIKYFKSVEPNKWYFLEKGNNYYRHIVLPGSIYGRKCKALAWNMFQKKAHAPLFLNQLNLLKTFFAKKKKIQINQESTMVKWQPTGKPFPFIRGSFLSLQAYIRKYIKLPALIILKNVVRQLLFQPSEWEKDWTDLSQELYIDCDYAGTGLSVGVRFPNFFRDEGAKQIKIIKPFQLRFWTRSFATKEYLDDSENYSFLTLWGQETQNPFGKIKKSPSFWQLLVERIKLILRHKILKNLSLDSVRLQGLQENSMVDNRLVSPQARSNGQNSYNEQVNTEQSDFSLKKLDEEKIKKLNQKIQDYEITKFNKKTNKVNNLNTITNYSNLNKTKKINHTRKYTVESIAVIIQKRWFYFYRFVLKKERELFFNLNRNLVQMKKFYVRQNTKIVKIFTKLSYNIYRLLNLVYSQLAELFSFFFMKRPFVQKRSSSTRQTFELKSNKNLSQAYIIHSIWTDRMMTRPDMTCLMKSWPLMGPLKKNLVNFLNKQGILGTSCPENLTDQHWKEWLRTFRGYTPSLKLWKNIYPNYWTQAVEQYWQELPSNVNQNTVGVIKQPLKNSTVEIKNKFLDHCFAPLFQAAQKQKKLWTFNILSHTYTDLYHDGDVDSFFIWKTTDFDKKMSGFFEKIKRGAEHKNKNVVRFDPTTLSSLIQSTKNSKIKSTQQEILKAEWPIIQREKKRLTVDRKLETRQERVNFLPVSTKRWKMKKLKNKLRKLAKTVIKRPIYGASRPQVAFSEKNKKMLKELFESENMLFSNNLENWNSKVLDDELLMYNIVSSILKFTNKKRSLLNIDDSSSLLPKFKSTSGLETYFVLPEEIFLPNYLRELKILDSLDFENDNEHQLAPTLSQAKTNYDINDSQIKEKSVQLEMNKKLCLILEQNQNVLQSRQKIVRFLWPTHRLEDLACINRFWMGATQQSRFSLLRIQTVP